jgi:hypothetical protein
MPLLENGLKGNIVTGLAIGIGAAVLGPVLIPALANVAKPLVKAAIKGGILLYEKGKESVAEAGEMVEDLMAEAKVELAESRNGQSDSAGAVEGRHEG